jgi:hypothetical protein
MKFWIIYVLILTILGVSSIYIFIDSQKQPQITSPLILNGNAFPTLTPTNTPTPTPSPTPTPTPTPTPIPTPVPLTSTNLEDLFTKYANFYSVNKDLLRKIAACESGFNTNASYGDYLGMFQFSSGAWINSRALMGEDSNLGLRTSAEESIKTAAFKISRGEVSAWPSCSK